MRISDWSSDVCSSDLPEHKALVPPVHHATTFERPPGGIGTAGGPGFSYSRNDNPSYTQVEALLARLQGGVDALVMASGMSAVPAPFLALAPADPQWLANGLHLGVGQRLTYVTHPSGQ